jgi:hypothetical protein
MNVDLALIEMEVDAVPTGPQASGSDRLDTAFEASDYGLPDEIDADTIVMKLPQGRFAKTTRARMRSCKTEAELRALDAELYRSCGLDPAAYGI